MQPPERRGAGWSSDLLRKLGLGGGAPPPPRSPPTSEPPPPTVGRYRIGQQLGAGGMGVVYSAYDPHLDRNVAVKLLRAAAELPEERNRQRDRMLREARAMARLTDPNVVRVYDSEEFAGGVYIAMELVVGPTLQAWRTERVRGWRETLEMFIQAGRGLAAAHAKGLIHRDFKPENVLIALVDGRAQVTDFGLVCEGSDAITSGPDAPASDTEAPGVGVRSRFTRQSEIFGTFVYMAPEQHQSADVDTRADQFSFCLALYEALFHLDLRVEGPRLANDWRIEPPAGSDVPPGIVEALRRGLQRRPEARWPSVKHALAALEEAATAATAGKARPARRRRAVRWVALTGGALTAVVLGLRGLRSGGECHLRFEPTGLQYTPPFNFNSRCSCSPRSPTCHQLYQGAVQGVDGYWAQLRFKKVTGGPPSRDVRYWVLYGADAPVCQLLEDYPEATSGTWSEYLDTLVVDNVPVWPSAEAFAAAPAGSTQTLFLVTGDGAGDTNARTWYQPQPLVFTKVCD